MATRTSIGCCGTFCRDGEHRSAGRPDLPFPGRHVAVVTGNCRDRRERPVCRDRSDSVWAFSGSLLTQNGSNRSFRCCGSSQIAWRATAGALSRQVGPCRQSRQRRRTLTPCRRLPRPGTRACRWACASESPRKLPPTPRLPRCRQAPKPRRTARSAQRRKAR
jgi:hypothetical protein